MKIRLILICLAILPAMANAEVYKWKDKDGSVRYSDIPPPSNIKQEPMLGKKTVKPTGQAPLTAVEGDVMQTINRNKTPVEKEKSIADKNATDKAPLSKDEAAAKRAKEAEEQKKADEAKREELKIKQENCRVAKSNLATFVNGGRITKTNENGERTYLSDADIDQGKVDAQRDVDKYCD